LTSVWLKPTMGSLEKLSLYSNFYWGFYPKLSLEGVHFPKLKSLALGNFSFFEDKQLDWILSHSKLEELYLDDCPILFHTRILNQEECLANCPIPRSDMNYRQDERWADSWLHSYKRRWSDYFASIEAGLPRLRRFAFGHNEHWDLGMGLPFEKELDVRPALMKDRYMAFNGGLGPSQFIAEGGTLGDGEDEWPSCDDEDREALKALYRKIGQRVDCGEITIGYREVRDLVQVSI
jgi:hypothetical protein